MPKILLSIFLLILLSSCSSTDYKKFILPKSGEIDKGLSVSLESGEKTIVILKTSAAMRSVGRKGSADSTRGEFNWCKKDEKNNCEEIFSLEPKKFYEYYVIKPGEYYFENVEQLRPALIAPTIVGALAMGFFAGALPPRFNSALEGWDRKLNAPNFISFEAKPKEIVYVGDLVFSFVKQKRWLRGKIEVSVIDNYEDAVHSFYSIHPEFKNRKVIKRLALPGLTPDKFEGTFW